MDWLSVITVSIGVVNLLILLFITPMKHQLQKFRENEINHLTREVRSIRTLLEEHLQFHIKENQ